MAETLASEIRGLAAGVGPLADMHTPVPVNEEALRDVERMGADCLVAIGLGKVLALRIGLPQIVLPTTYACSEATPGGSVRQTWLETVQGTN